MPLVFVYGSLKRGFGNHRLLEKQTYLGDAETAQRLRMVSLKWFPGVVYDQNAGTVLGEVYEVDDDAMRRLDQLEGHPHHYRREEVLLVDSRLAWCYIYQPDASRLPVVQSGYWSKPCAA